MTKKIRISVIVAMFLNFTYAHIYLAEGATVQLKCASSLLGQQIDGYFKCIENEKKGTMEWKDSTIRKNLSKWDFASEIKLKADSKPDNICFTKSKNFNQCLAKQKGTLILLIGDSQIQSGVNIVSFSGSSKSFIVSSEPGCPPLVYGSIENDSLYGLNCITANENRISREIYERVSGVMIVSAGRYTPFDLDQYLTLLGEYKIRNIIFIGPYVRSLTKFSDYISNYKTERLIKTNYNFYSYPELEVYNPNSTRFQPNLFDSVTKKHDISYINPIKQFCVGECRLFFNGWPLLIDTHHWSFNFAMQIYLKNYTLISDWLAKDKFN